MMSETVVTVQDGSTNANNPRQGPTVKTEPGQTSIIGGITINIPYFKSIPGILKLVQLTLRTNMSSNKLPLNWSPPDDIDDIISIEFDQEEQSELACVNNEHVFLEYPWAYVTRRNVIRLAAKAGSTLEAYKDRIEGYKPDWMLIAYASAELASCQYVLCLTEEARDFIVCRNREISRGIWEKVTRLTLKHPLDVWNDEKTEDSEETVLKSLRPPFEIEVTLKTVSLGKPRNLSDRNSDDTRDGYICLLPSEKFDNVPMKLISKSLQTTLKAKDASVQTYLGYPKNKWTQYDDLFPAEAPGDDGMDGQTIREESSPTGHSENLTLTDERASKVISKDALDEEAEALQESLKIFLDSHISEMIDCILYNSEINMHSDDVENLAKFNGSIDTEVPTIDYSLNERNCLVNLSVTKGKIISGISWHPSRRGYVALCYVDLLEDPGSLKKPKFDVIDDPSILIWCIDDPLKPKLLLSDWREAQVLSFCPTRDTVVVGGCRNGQIVLWDLENAFSIIDSNEETDFDPRIESSASSDPNDSHVLPIRSINWLPSYCRIESTGKLTKIPDNMSMQFLTTSEDGSVAIWDLLWQPNMQLTAKNLLNVVSAKLSLTDSLERLDGIFRPQYRLNVLPPKESSNLTLLDLSLPSEEVYKTVQTDSIDSDVNMSLRKLWFGTIQGEILLCTWRGQELDEITSEIVDIEHRSSLVHDGPVIKLLRSHHITDVLLTIGGSVFALWKDNYLRRPLLWRKRNCNYTSCCWCNKPGVFILSRSDGDLETWDIYRKSREPIHLQTISGKLITGLYMEPNWSSFIIGICDYNGSFKITTESTDAVDFDERLQWFRGFVDREISRKREFYEWQDDYLVNDKLAVDRKTVRQTEEAKRRHAEAREKFLKEQEEAARIKAEKKAAKVPKSKETILKMKNVERMKAVLLAKKGFDPSRLDEARHPIVKQQEEKIIRMIKAGEKVEQMDNYYFDALSVEFPSIGDTHGSSDVIQTNLNTIAEDEENYLVVRNEAIRIMENPGIPKFDWNSVMKEGKRRKDDLKNL